MKILVINAGSSSLKFQLIDMDDESVKAKGLVERIGIEGTHFKQTVLGTDKVIEFTRNMKDHTEAISAVLSALTDKDNGAIASLDEIGACGHRVLHGGETFKNSVLVTEETIKGIEDLVPLGPLHQPANIAGIKACQAVMPTKPNVAVFDTAFHQIRPTALSISMETWIWRRNWSLLTAIICLPLIPLPLIPRSGIRKLLPR